MRVNVSSPPQPRDASGFFCGLVRRGFPRFMVHRGPLLHVRRFLLDPARQGPDSPSKATRRIPSINPALEQSLLYPAPYFYPACPLSPRSLSFSLSRSLSSLSHAEGFLVPGRYDNSCEESMKCLCSLCLFNSMRIPAPDVMNGGLCAGPS